MPSIFSGSGILLVLSNMVFYLCLTFLAIGGSIVLGDPGFTRSFVLIFISQSYIVFIWHMTNTHRCHIGIQLWTTDVLHNLAYQVIPTILNCRQLPDPCELPLNYWVSCNDLLVEDILFNWNPPAFGEPYVDEDEVLRIPPLYTERCPLIEGIVLYINRDKRPRPFGLPNGPRGHCRGTRNVTHPLADCVQRHAYLDWISDAEVNQVLSHVLYPKIAIGNRHDEPIGSRPFWGNLNTINHSEERTNPLTRLLPHHQNANNP